MKFVFYAFLGIFNLCYASLQAVEVPADLLLWANENPIITVGIEDNFPPFDYTDEGGKPTGVGELVRQQLSEILPIDLQVVSQGSFAAQLDKLAEKQINMISVCAATADRNELMLFTKPFLSLTPIIVVHENSNYQTIEDIPKSSHIAVPEGYASISSALRIVDEENIIKVSSTFMGVEMVNSGKVDGFVTYLSAKSYFIQKHGFTHLEALPVTGVESTPLGFCVDKNTPELVSLLNAGIEQLGSDYFSHLQAEWIASLSEIDIKSSEGSFSVNTVVFLSLLVLVLLIYLMRRYAQLLANKFETFRFKLIYFSVLMLILASVFLALEYYFDSFRVRIVEDQKESFDITREVAIQSIDDWYLPRLKVLQEIVRTSLFQPEVEKLVGAYQANNMQLFDQQTSWLTAFFHVRPYLAEEEWHYEIIAPDTKILLGSRGRVNEQSVIKKYYPELFERILAGESLFIPSIDIKGKANFPVVHIAKPILGLNGNVVAILAVSFNANKSFSSLFNDVRLGQTVESYAVNKQGYLLSESRFISQLHKDKTLPFGKSAILQMSVADAQDSPIAYDAQFQTAGRNLTGYQDYMGHTVVGQWSWIEKYNFMLVSEVSLDEMYFEYTKLHNILFIALILSITLITATSLFMMIISHRANQINRLSKEKLEELVQKRTQALVVLEEKNSLIVDSVADGILGLNAQGMIVFFNSAAEQMLGYKETDILNKNYQDILYFCDSERSDQIQQKEQIQHSLVKGENLHVSKDYFCHIDESQVPVSYSLSVINDENSPFKAVITFQDISQRLLESQRTRALLASLPVAIFLINMNRKIVEINTATEELLGYQKEDIFGKELAHFIPADRQEEHAQIMDRFFSEPKYIRMGNDRQVTVQTKSGSIIEVEAIFSVMELNGEQMTVLSVIDITEANQTKKLLIEAKEFADEASLSKSDFLANMSHEIRTPMNAIIGMSMLALQGSLQDKERNYVSKVHSAATNLLGIINDILDFSKIEAGKLELENRTFALTDMLDHFSTIVGLKTQEKGIDLVFNIDHDVPLFFIGDLLRLNQVLINLGGNAAKFTDQGEIILKVSISEIDGERIKLLFSIKDSGIGIKPEQLKKLFSAFSQADASTTRKYGGTGLGLSISKRLVTLMEGDIWAESIDGQGSEFFFNAWLTIDGKDKSAQILETAQVRLAGKRVLIVDDSLITLATLKEVVKGFGCEAFTAHSGQQALAIAEKISHFDFALIDWDMPVMNGLEVCDVLQSTEGILIDHLILISAYGREQIRESDYIDRVDSLLSKPITAQRLHQALQSSLGYEPDPEIQPERIVNAQQNGLAGAKILLVEDNELNQELASALLEDEGVIVSHAAHGEIAVSMVQDNSYDGILMDIQMPVMDGYKATKLIREFNQKIPILAMTANAMAGEKDKVIKAGMNDYISKPINVEAMFLTINKWIKPKISAVLPVPLEIPYEFDTATLFTHFSSIDQQAGIAICNGNNELYIKILTKFDAGNKTFNENFGELKAAQSWLDLTRLVHSLKGGAGNIGAKTLYALLNDLELACESPDRGIDIDALFANSMSELVAVNKEISIMLALLEKQKKETISNDIQLTKVEIESKLIELQQLVGEFDTGAQDIAITLQKGIDDQVSKVLLNQFITELENFDFDSANQTLIALTNKLMTQE